MGGGGDGVTATPTFDILSLSPLIGGITLVLTEFLSMSCIKTRHSLSQGEWSGLGAPSNFYFPLANIFYTPMS